MPLGVDRITGVQEIIEKGASGLLHVYGQEQWIEIGSGQMEFKFNVVLPDISPPFELRAEITYYFYPEDVHRLVFGDYSDEAVNNQEDGDDTDKPNTPSTEFMIKVVVPIKPHISILQRIASAIVDRDVAIIKEHRVLGADRSFDAYSIEYFWRVVGETLLDEEVWRSIFEELRNLLKELSHLTDDGKQEG